MIEIRRARPADVQAIVDIAVESVTTVDPLPLTIDKVAMAEMARELIAGNQHFIWVAEQGGKVVACVAAHCSRGFWFKGMQASVLLFWSRVPGAGVQLLRQFATWVESRPLLKIAVIECEPSVDPRTVRFLRRIGFKRQSANLSFVRNMK